MIDTSREQDHVCNTRSSSAGIDIVRDTVEEDKVDEVGGIDKIVVTGARVGSMDGCAEGIGVGAVGAKVGAVGADQFKEEQGVTRVSINE